MGEEEIIPDEAFDPMQIKPIGKYEDMTMRSDENEDRSLISSDVVDDEDTLNPLTK